MARIPWRTLLLWAVPLIAFAWLSVAGRAAGDTRAVLPKPGAILGGGALGHRFVPQANFGLHFTTVSVSADGRKVKFYGDWNGRCEGFPGPVTAAFFQEVDLERDGSFSGKGPLESRVAAGTFEFDGKFTANGVARGTGRVKFTFRPDAPGRGYECGTGNVTWQVRSGAGVFGRAKPRPGRAYFGNTSQRLPMLLRVSKDGRSVAMQALLWSARCKKNTSGLGRGTASPSVRIKHGRFSFTERYSETYGEFVAQITSSHSGTFGLTTVAGTWRVRVDVRRASDNTRADSCDSGRISWAARI